jgi:hypothetical protein
MGQSKERRAAVITALGAWAESVRTRINNTPGDVTLPEGFTLDNCPGLRTEGVWNAARRARHYGRGGAAGLGLPWCKDSSAGSRRARQAASTAVELGSNQRK